MTERTIWTDTGAHQETAQRTVWSDAGAHQQTVATPGGSSIVRQMLAQDHFNGGAMH